MIRQLTALILVFITMNIAAQEAAHTKSYTQRMLIGIGKSDVLDTYLSPYSHEGVRFSLTTERTFEHTSHTFNLQGSAMENPAGNVNEYDFLMRYSLAHFYHIMQTGRWNLALGPMGHAEAGGIYNERNGNNPAQLKLSAMCDVAVRLSYDFSLWQRPWQVEWGLSSPLLGLAYSPQFGQSYYEQFVLNDYDHNCVIAHLFNTPSMRYRLLLAFPLWRSRGYAGIDGIIDQSRYNHLRYHSYSCLFTFGFQL